MRENRICPYCNKYIDGFEPAQNIGHTTTAARKGTAKTMSFYHISCYDEVVRKNKEARKRRPVE